MNQGLLKKIASVVVVLIVIFFLWYFRGIVLYVALAAVVSLIGRPLMSLFGHIKIGRWTCPPWICAIMTLIVIVAALAGLVLLLIPLFHQVSANFSGWEVQASRGMLADHLDSLNEWIITTFPTALGENFTIQTALFDYARDLIGAGGSVPDMVKGAFSTLLDI